MLYERAGILGEMGRRSDGLLSCWLGGSSFVQCGRLEKGKWKEKEEKIVGRTQRFWKYVGVEMCHLLLL